MIYIIIVILLLFQLPLLECQGAWSVTKTWTQTESESPILERISINTSKSKLEWHVEAIKDCEWCFQVQIFRENTTFLYVEECYDYGGLDADYALFYHKGDFWIFFNFRYDASEGSTCVGCTCTLVLKEKIERVSQQIYWSFLTFVLLGVLFMLQRKNPR